LQERLDDILELNFADNRKRWEMQADGSYVQQRPGDDPPVNVQRRLMARTMNETGG
jgi:polyphosphate kinase